MAAGRGYPAIKAPNGEGHTVQLHGGGSVGPLIIADIHPETAGAAVRVYAGPGGDLELTDEARACL